jgi:SAM-dependent methyltransferase
MTERYDSTAAAHYAAYRPPLHRMILGRVLSGDESFETGLDVGCGTGYSAVELAAYCAHVYGIDPSPSMLSRATAHERVSYLEGAGERIPLPDGSVDLVTFAGSLFYADSAATRGELRRVGRHGAVVIAYDFEILLDEVLHQIGVDARVGETDYDHRANFSGARGFEELAVGSERIGLRLSAAELAHILLSDSHRLDRLAQRYGSPDPFPQIAEELDAASERSAVEAEIYYSKYELAG